MIILLDCTKSTKDAIEGIFGEVGVVLEKHLRKLANIFILQDMPGIFPPLSYNRKSLMYPDRPCATSKDFIELFGESLTDFICGPADLETESLDQDKPQLVFQNVLDDQRRIRQGFRIFLFFRSVQVRKLYVLSYIL